MLRAGAYRWRSKTTYAPATARGFDSRHGQWRTSPSNEVPVLRNASRGPGCVTKRNRCQPVAPAGRPWPWPWESPSPAARAAATVPTAGSQPTTTAAQAGGSASPAASPLAEAVAYSQCIRSHGVPNFPDPVQTPSGGYGYRTTGIDPNSAAFQGAQQACQALPSPWNSTGSAALPRPAAGVVELGQVHPRQRRAEPPRPDLPGRRRSPPCRLWRVELAAVAAGDGRLQVPAADHRWSGRVTGNCRSQVEQLVASGLTGVKSRGGGAIGAERCRGSSDGGISVAVRAPLAAWGSGPAHSALDQES